MQESLFTSGGLLEIMDMRNRLVILNLDNYVYYSPENLKLLKDNSDFKDFALQTDSELCFRLTEPCMQTFVPKVSEPKIGFLKSVDTSKSGDFILNVELRPEFRPLDEETDQ